MVAARGREISIAVCKVLAGQASALQPGTRPASEPSDTLSWPGSRRLLLTPE
jgi:hypothetical protein